MIPTDCCSTGRSEKKKTESVRILASAPTRHARRSHLFLSAPVPTRRAWMSDLSPSFLTSSSPPSFQ